MAAEGSQNPGYVVKKKVDESWKEAVVREKGVSAESPAQPENKPKTNPLFPHFLSSIAMQALLALGEIPDPVTGEKMTDPDQAKYMIDVVQMISEKTKGNLSAEESKLLEDLLYELRVKFVNKNKPV